MTAPSAARIAAIILQARAGIEMDLYARARIIEGAGGLPKWTLSRQPLTFLREGPSQFPNIHPDWFSNRDQGVADAVLQGAEKVLKSQTGEATAEEIAQNMAAGLGIGGDVKADVYGYVGERMSRQILSGALTPKGVKTALYGYAKDRALDTWRKKQRHENERNKSHPSLVGPADLGEASAEVALDRSPNEVMLSLISGPAGQKFRNWIYETIQRKATEVQKIILEVTLDYLAKTGDWPSANAIRDKVIESKGSDISIRKINEHRKRVEELIAEEMKNNPQALDWAERYLDLAALGYGGGQLRSAKRVASRYLAARAFRLDLDDQAEVDLARWQKDVGTTAFKALDRFPGVVSVERPALGSNHGPTTGVRMLMTLEPPTHWADMDSHDQAEVTELRAERITDYLERALKPFMSVGRGHSPYGGFFTSGDYIFPSSSDAVSWRVDIQPHPGR